MKRRSTRQLKATYEALASSRDHPTADEVLERVRRVLPRVSLGTVYRNLDKLREQGRLRVVRLGGGVAHYDITVAEHDHFVCEACGAVLDLERTGPRSHAQRLQRAGFLVRWQSTAVYGICQSCAQRSDGQEQRSVLQLAKMSQHPS